MAMEGKLVYLDAENTNEGRAGHAYHMSVGRVLRVSAGGGGLYAAMCEEFLMWLNREQAHQCLDTRGPYFLGDVVFGVRARDCLDNHSQEWCTCLSVGLVHAIHRRGIDVEFGHDRGGRVIRMRRRDIRLATKGAAHLTAEETEQLVRPVAATCRHAAGLLRKPQTDRIAACCRALVGLN